MVKKEQLKIISKIAGKISDLNYAFIGSINFALQGISIDPRDIGILLDAKSFNQFDKRFDRFRTKEKYYDESEARNSWRAFYQIDEVEIEILQNVDNFCRPKDELAKKLKINFDGTEINCSSLKSELSAYQKMGRYGKVKLIKEFLEKIMKKILPIIHVVILSTALICPFGANCWGYYSVGV